MLLVDDSGFMRMAIRKMIEHDSEINIVAEATSGEEAIRLASQLRPDVITMDIEMPGQCGLMATQEIMKECPTAIIMLSSLTTASSKSTMKALSYGAVDYISKVSSFVDLDIVSIEAELLKKIHYWAIQWPAVRLKTVSSSYNLENLEAKKGKLELKTAPDILVIGASTGGPKIIPELFKNIKKIQYPIVIALHMPPLYTESFAAHLNDTSGHKAVEGYDGMELNRNEIVIAPGGLDSFVIKDSKGKYLLSVKKAETYTIHPSVDELFISVAETAKNAAGIILSGMGVDGVKGAEKFRKKNFPVVVQNEETCLVFGMPKAVFDAGFATEVMAASEISERISSWSQI